MNKIRKDVKVLIISWSPVPTPKYQKIEGSGQRFWGLARGLKKNGVSDITIAVGGIYPLDVEEVDGIKLFNYNFDEKFANKIKQYDTIISNYAIHGSSFIFKNIPDNKQVIIDAYGPAYIESLAREPKDLVNTYTGNLAAVEEIFNKVLPRGDFILYANDAQEKFYTGILAALGSINQFSYKTNKLLRVPFGIDKPVKNNFKNPYIKYGISKDDFILLWFGGLYPWFDITKVLDSIKELEKNNVKLVIVGGNNPQNQHPDFVKHYFDTVDYIKNRGLSDRVIFIDWVDYSTRRKYYEFANAIISVNSEGKENTYSWRTRVMDYVGSTTPLITNGGDPLSDELVEIGAAFKIDDKDDNSIKDTISKLVNNPEELKIASQNMENLQPKYYWENVTKELAEKIKNQEKPFEEERHFRQINGITDKNNNHIPKRNLLKKIKGNTGMVVRKVKADGIVKTSVVIGAKARRRAVFEYTKRFKKLGLEKSSKIYIFSNQLNNTGAPFVLIDLVHSLVKKYPELTKKIHFIAFTPIEVENVKKLRNLGVFVDIYTNRELPLQFNEGDIVVLNTFAVSGTTMGSIIRDTKSGKISKIFWYGHEASPKNFINKDVRKIFKKFLKENKAKIYAVSEQTRKEYSHFFKNNQNIEKMPFRFLLDESRFRTLEPKDFEKIEFINTGSLMDMRKGQYPILYAFLDFYHNYYQKNPDNYRDFKIKFIGAYDKSDLAENAPYHIQNIKKQFEDSAKELGDKFEITSSLSHDEALDNILGSQSTICYSMYEALPIFVYEGMAMGHPIIRNDCSGAEEQIFEGENGFKVFENKYSSLPNAIEEMLNKKKVSNEELSEMSRKSNEIARAATKNKYQIIEEIKQIFNE